MATILRKFLYLDSAAVDTHLATLEGYVVEGLSEHTETKKGTRSSELGLSKVVSAKRQAGADESAEVKQKRAITGPSRFQRLYELVEAERDAPLDAFDVAIWSQFKRGEILEIEASTRVPELFVLNEAIDSAAEIAGAMAHFGINPLSDPDTRSQFDQALYLAEPVGHHDVPLVLNPISTP